MDDETLLCKLVDDAREFKNFEQIVCIITVYPEWLTRIPSNRSWSILHQIVFSGDLLTLDRVLATQKNVIFDPYHKTKDEKTIIDIAKSRASVKDVLERVERLKALDDMLALAKNAQWDEAYAMIVKDPTMANEKPPYRRFYLIHQIAYHGAIDQFERFNQIPECDLNVYLKADDKSITEIARESGKNEFASKMEEKWPFLKEFPSQQNSGSNNQSADIHTQSAYKLAMSNDQVKHSLEKLLSSEPKGTNARKAAEFEAKMCAALKQPTESSTVSSTNIKITDAAIESIMKSIVCPLSGFIMENPVTASDGITYEESAILKYLKTNENSKITNQKMTKTLVPNKSLALILQTLKSSIQ